ncbi:copper chaperone PCu(A)C [Campylobacter suis]|uniref:Copper chaperone PCu(A)C n=1 Tax=Campylobacter suis TaxID=2790657 RepID=A0ABN7KC81_9BACT|nr:copper chaperone PCu(A)C [Campylobacter suis]CAD7289117.1 hypothetical protein LMG8286_01656 [Campylobacter suis]
MKKILLLSSLLALGAFASEISIEKIYAKESMKSAANGAIFMDITNNLGADIKLVSASSNVSDSVELHEHKTINGMSMMSKVDDIAIANKETVHLKPGGLHIMLMGLKKQLVNGDEIDLSLKFDTGRVINLKVDVVNHKQLFLE